LLPLKGRNVTLRPNPAEVRMEPVPRLLPWVASILYGAVLAAGLAFAVAGLCAEPAVRTVGFVAVLGFLIGLEVVERRLPVSRGLAIGLLAVRLVAYWGVGALECSGFSRILYVLIPFLAYFSLGRKASYALAVLLAGGLTVALTLSTPSWYRDPEQVSDVLMLATGLVLAVSMAAVATHAQRLVGQVAELATAAERNRLARDLHDSLGHQLTVIAVQLEKAAAFRERDPAAADQAIADARLSTRYALEDVRESVGSLREGFALEPALRTLVARMDDGRLAVSLSIEGDETRFARPALIALYRAAQEGLTNASRHAEASSVSVRVNLDDAAARLVVADDGCGFERPAPGFGLRGMDERLASVGGSLEVSSSPGSGTRLLVMIPRSERP
jgi:signal transduction histidine kinase